MPNQKKQKQKKTQITQEKLVLEFFKKHPNRDIPHKKSVDWSIREWKKRTGETLRDPDRAIRKLYEAGFLIKIKKGVYRYDPKKVRSKKSEDFTESQKKKILKRDEYKCVICGHGKKDGEELHVDHIKPKAKGGKAHIANGQVLCSKHNIIKKDLKQTETGKKMFMRLYELAKEKNHKDIEKFCLDILDAYEEHKMNGHIVWKK